MKIDTHKSSHKLLKLASHDKKFLSEILNFSASKLGFLSGKNPLLLVWKFLEINFQRIANFLIPLPQNI